MQRTPNGETVTPRLRSSLETRAWPHRPQRGRSASAGARAGRRGGRLVDRQGDHRRLDRRLDPVLQDRLAPRQLLQRQLATLVVQLLEPVEAVAAVLLHCRCTSAIHTAHGSAARTRTPTGCCGSTSPKGTDLARTARMTSRPWLRRSTQGRARRSAGERQPKLLMRCCDQRRQVLRRPLESALDAAIAMVDQAAALDGTAIVQRLLQRVQHEGRHGRYGDTRQPTMRRA